MTPKFYGKVEEGKLTLHHPAQFRWHIADMDGEVELTVKKRKKSRSNNQNAYYWGVVIEMLSGELGYTPSEMHEALKWHFLKDETRKMPTVKSTTDLSTKEFEDYLENIRRFAATEFSTVIPLPNDVDYL